MSIAVLVLVAFVHRYPGRVLLGLVGHLCQVYCRFCFAAEVVGPQQAAKRYPRARLPAALAYIQARPAIWKSIPTHGGDPLVLSLLPTAKAVRASPRSIM